MGRGRKRRRVVSDEEWEKDRDDHVPARLAVLSAKGTREVEDKPVLSRLRRFTNTAQDVSKGSNLDSLQLSSASIPSAFLPWEPAAR